MVALRPGQGDSGLCTFLVRVATVGVQGEACRQRTGLAALHARFAWTPRGRSAGSPWGPEARAGPAAAPLPGRLSVPPPGPGVCRALGHRPWLPQVALVTEVGGTWLPVWAAARLVFGLPHPTSDFSSQVSALCMPSAHVRPAASRLPEAPPSLPQLCEVASGGFTWLSPSGSASPLAPEYTVQLLAKEGKTSHRLPKCTYSHSVMAFQLSGSFLSQEWQSGVGSWIRYKQWSQHSSLVPLVMMGGDQILTPLTASAAVLAVLQ